MADPSERDAYDPLTPVPDGRRTFTPRDAFSLWFSLGIGLLVLEAGSFLVPGLSMGAALVAIFVGSLVGAGLLGLAAVVGSDTGLSAMASLRPTLGVRGAGVAAIINIVQLVGWGAFEIIAMRDAADALVQRNFGLHWPVVWTILFGAAATGLALAGPLSVVRRFLRHWGLWLLLAGAAWMSWSLLSRTDWSQLFARPGDGTLSLASGIDLVVAMPLSWLPLIADYSRFGKSPGGMLKGSAGGYLLANIWFYSLGAAFALTAHGNPDGLLLAALAATGGGLALLLILIDETDNVFADIFSAATSTGTLFPVKMTYLVVGFGLLSTLIALFVPMGKFLNFLYGIGGVFTPLFAVMLIDHFVVRQRKIVADDVRNPFGIYRFTYGVHLSAFVAWGFGIATYQYFHTWLPTAGATLPAFFVAAFAYWALSHSFSRLKAPPEG
ncbi:permease for cytosine/purine, uracil, thiamine, allantoin family protein [Asticcacaulis biprosthecium C19]|uniref:Permease for cytosine/purine, uracil, thiamine, allantoin family protein n=1 Tax=Asticcacaulis biprosthecium C19 TaxID=715226 RepID=F4QTM7_9CAUL|nr:putative hydroxymethylpyrimidine transporter CytX [Asticcacaulis biprosthecium]EGF89177.1 permease for cytosine/purine, uracil, thiamine, allantoin family protein [Asticcacaulis biprosthecium C19]